MATWLLLMAEQERPSNNQQFKNTISGGKLEQRLGIVGHVGSPRKNDVASRQAAPAGAADRTLARVKTPGKKKRKCFFRSTIVKREIKKSKDDGRQISTEHGTHTHALKKSSRSWVYDCCALNVGNQQPQCSSFLLPCLGRGAGAQRGETTAAPQKDKKKRRRTPARHTHILLKFQKTNIQGRRGNGNRNTIFRPNIPSTAG